MTIGAVALVHLALAYALISLSGVARLPGHDALTQLIDIAPPPPPPVVVDAPVPRAERKEASASAKNIASKATPVAAPKPVVPVPSPNPVIATTTPRQGVQATQGASNVTGPGTGAGGVGNGDGSGGSGDGLAAIRTRLDSRSLSGRDFPPELLDNWPRGAWVRMRFRVDANGAIVQCLVDQGTGNPAIDNQVCAIARQRLRYRPALNRSGQRVADWAGYGQEPPR